MVFLWKPWFNSGMFKDEAIALLGGSAVRAAELMGVTYQAVNKWPDSLPQRIADRVLGVCVRNRINVPTRYFSPKPPPAPVPPAQAAINCVVGEVA